MNFLAILVLLGVLTMGFFIGIFLTIWYFVKSSKRFDDYEDDNADDEA